MAQKSLVTGDRAIDNWFSLAESRLQRQLLRGATAAGGTVLAKQIRRNITTMLGTRTPEQRKGKRPLRKTVIKKYWARPDKGIIASIVGPRYGKGWGPHAHLVEQGHRIVTARGMRGYSRAFPFQKTAERQAAAAVFTAQVQYIRKRFNRVMSR